MGQRRWSDPMPRGPDAESENDGRPSQPTNGGFEDVDTRSQRIGTGRSRWGLRSDLAPCRRGAIVVVGVVITTALSSMVALVGTDPTGAASPAAATLTVNPSSGLTDNQTVSVVVTGASPGTTYVAVECDPTAFTLQAEGASPGTPVTPGTTPWSPSTPEARPPPPCSLRPC